MFMREGGSSNAEAQNHDLSQKVIRPERLSWPRTWKETHFSVLQV